MGIAYSSVFERMHRERLARLAWSRSDKDAQLSGTASPRENTDNMFQTNAGQGMTGVVGLGPYAVVETEYDDRQYKDG